MRLLERYLDPLEVLTCNDYLGLARCLLLIYRDQRGNVRAYAGMLMRFVMRVVEDKLEDRVKRQRLREYVQGLSSSRIELYGKWIGVQIVGANAIASFFSADSFLRAFCWGGHKTISSYSSGDHVVFRSEVMFERCL